MTLLQDERIRLRAMEPEDCEAMYRWENDTALWHLGDISRPLSRAALQEFIAGASLDIYAAKQIRLIIELVSDSTVIGCIDLFDFEPMHRRAGVGILIYEPSMRGHGYAAAALQLMAEYAFQRLELRMIWADIPASNTLSIKLFEKVGFSGDAVRTAWVRTSDERYEDAIFVQLFR